MRLRLLAALCLGLLLLPHAAPTSARSAGARPNRIVEIPIEGTIEMGLAPFVERAIAEAEADGADALLFRVDTFGGRIDAAVRIRDAILRTPLPTVAWVEGRAISAGALITLAAETIVYAEGASIGAAQPVTMAPGGAPEETGEKTISYMRGEMRATAEARGRDPHVAEAMVDASIEIEGVIAEGKLLTLTAGEALELGMGEHIAHDRDAMYEILGWEKARTDVARPTWAELLVRFLTNPIMAGLLLSLGGLGLLLELRTPGVGLPGLVGIICLALYFGSHWLVHLAGNVEIFLFLAGIVLIILEVFVIPGFGIVGILGGISLAAGILLSRLVPHGAPGDLSGALAVILGSFAVTVLLFILLARYLPEARWMHGIVLSESQQHTEGFHADQHEDQGLLGKTGRALTDLRPAGTIEIEGRRLDAITPGDYLDRGSPLRVIEVQANRIVVELSDTSPSSDERDNA